MANALLGSREVAARQALYEGKGSERKRKNIVRMQSKKLADGHNSKEKVL